MSDLGLQVCGACKKARYCSRDCQVSHWNEEHQAKCGQDPVAARPLSSAGTPVAPVAAPAEQQNHSYVNVGSLGTALPFMPVCGLGSNPLVPPTFPHQMGRAPYDPSQAPFMSQPTLSPAILTACGA